MTQTAKNLIIVGTLGERIEAARRRRGIDQRTLAKKIGVTATAISHWERDGSIPRFDRMVALAEELAVPLPWFVEGLQAESMRPVLEVPESELADLYKM